jgi:hypothetical protein
MIKHPVGEGWTMMSNPVAAMAHLNKNLVTGSALDQINTIFDLELLEPRRKAFEAAVTALRNP